MEQRNTGCWTAKHEIPVALTVAGSDSGGGAGIQADLRTFSALGVFGASAITAVTSQNPAEVTRVDGLPPEGVVSQIETVFRKLKIRAVKTGMLFSAEIIENAAAALTGKDCPIIVDPVMISTSGSKLLKDDALVMLQEKILPLASWITPNIPEAELISGMTIRSMEDAVSAAKKIGGKWGCGVILKGGHAQGDNEAADVICSGEKLFKLSTQRLALPPFAAHGTGCTLSSAIAACLARGMKDLEAIIAAKAFVLGSLQEARAIGDGVFGMFPPADLEKYKKLILIGQV